MEIKKFLNDRGISLFSAGSVKELKRDFFISREMDLTGIDFAISIAYPVPMQALSGIIDKPTLLYKHIYRQLNNLLDRTALELSIWLNKQGAKAIPIPASQIVDFEKNLAHLSHREVAVKLGMGFYGRNNLLVMPEFGAGVRLVTVLTDCELEIPGPAKGKNLGCASCDDCVSLCPVSAIRRGPSDFDRKACFAKVKEFEKIRGIGVGICGICVKACALRWTKGQWG